MLGKIFLHESVSLARWSGIVVISVGVMLVEEPLNGPGLGRGRPSMNAWFLLFVSVLSGSAGDLLNARSMRDHGEIHDFRPGALADVTARLARDISMLSGILAQAVSFFSFVALLGIAELSFAVPATALGNVAKTFFAKIFLGEHVCWRRWAGMRPVSLGVFLVSL